jgi:hypothetical protein
MSEKTLAQIVQERPYPDYVDWWPMGLHFLTFMSQAICGQWQAVPNNSGDLASVRDHTALYLQTVYQRSTRSTLVDDFIQAKNLAAIQSGEFDALSYAFFRAAFALLAQVEPSEYLVRARRQFTQRVGQQFFAQVNHRLQLVWPPGLDAPAAFEQLQGCIAQVGHFLKTEGYLRDHFAFRFDVDLVHQGRHIRQQPNDVVSNLQTKGVAYALYEMGYPVILPSAVYLYHTVGEAQHHSSRTIEALFAQVGYEARETDDFDPLGYPAEMVVELWEIRPRTSK